MRKIVFLICVALGLACVQAKAASPAGQIARMGNANASNFDEGWLLSATACSPTALRLPSLRAWRKSTLPMPTGALLICLTTMLSRVRSVSTLRAQQARLWFVPKAMA